jgi:hypothetical protein
MGVMSVTNCTPLYFLFLCNGRLMPSHRLLSLLLLLLRLLLLLLLLLVLGGSLLLLLLLRASCQLLCPVLSGGSA